MPRGGGGGHGPRAQAFEGAPAKLVEANFKKKIRPRQISKVTLLQCWINIATGLCGMGGSNSGGGGRCKHWPRALETLGTPLTRGPGP